MKIPLLLVFGVTVFTQCSNRDDIEQGNLDQVRSIGRNSVTFLNRPATILMLEVFSTDLNITRRVEVRVIRPSVSAKGALVLSTGGFGTNFYGIGLETNTTLNSAVALGLETYEVKWLGSEGWGTGVAGVGYPVAVRAYTSILRFLKQNEITNTQRIIAHGGSGGSFQIAYALARFNAEAEIHDAILIAGPPTSDLRQAIFGDKTLKSYWPDGIGGFRTTDYIHGWDQQGKYCQNRSQPPPAFVLEALDKSSILSKVIPPDLQYSTNVIFVNTNDITNADGQGRLYFEAITSRKQWHYLSNETSHDVAGIPAGAMKIRELLQELVK